MYAQWTTADNATVAARRVRVVHWVARATGVPRFDDGPLAARVGALPSWELLSFAYVAEVRTGRREFEGIVVIDREGFVVWVYATHAPAVWDWLPGPGYGMVLLSTADHNVQILSERGVNDGALADDGLTRLDNATGKLARANSMMMQVSPTGALERQYVQSCGGAPTNYNLLSHEMRVDGSSPGLSVLTTATTIRAFPELKARERERSPLSARNVPSLTSRAPRAAKVTTLLGTRSPCSSTVLCEPDSLVQVFAHAAGTQVVRWHRDANNVELVYGLFD